MPRQQFCAFHPFGQQRLGAGERQQAAGEGGRAGGAFHRIVEVVEDFAARAVETPAGEIDAADNDRQHVVEVVCDTASELADGFHLLDLAQLRLCGFALFRLGLQRGVGLPEFLSPVGNRFLQQFRALGLRLGELLRERKLPDGLD